MKREELVTSFDKIGPDKVTERRMFDNILSHSGKEKKMAFDFRRAIPALGLAIAIAGGILAYDLAGGRKLIPAPEYAIDNGSGASEDMVAPLLNQFELDGRHYILMSDDLRTEFGFPQQINESDIGEKITTITTSVDMSLIGSEVYYYKPAGSEAVVAVNKGNEYMLFKFFTFESYNNNQDEDAIEYLKLFGINNAEDIAKVQFIVYTERSKLDGKPEILEELTGRDEISRFYDYFSVLKNSSDKYFERLFGFAPVESGKKEVGIDMPVQIDPVAPDAPDSNTVYPVAPPESAVSHPGFSGYADDMPLTGSGQTPVVDSTRPISGNGSTGMMDMGEPGTITGGTTPAHQGAAGNALADPVMIRIYNQNGVYLETVYYKNIGFISRYEINEEFADFIESCIN